MSEYEDDISIDFDQLDINWRDHSANYMKWGEKWANSVAVKDRKKEVLDALKASLNAKYRKVLFQEDKKKPTEAAINAAIEGDASFQLAQTDLTNATEDMNILAIAKSSFGHRKKALEGLTQLWLGSYFSNPSIPAEIKDRFKKENPQPTNQTKVLNANQRLKKRKPIVKK